MLFLSVEEPVLCIAVSTVTFDSIEPRSQGRMQESQNTKTVIYREDNIGETAMYHH